MRDIPIALSLAVSEIGAKIDHLVEDEPLSNRSVQAWLEQVQAAQNISDTTLATSAIEFKISSFAASDERSATANKVQHAICSRCFVLTRCKRDTVPVAAGTKGLLVSGEYWNGVDTGGMQPHLHVLLTPSAQL